jgi:hypothetical protein
MSFVLSARLTHFQGREFFFPHFGVARVCCQTKSAKCFLIGGPDECRAATSAVCVPAMQDHMFDGSESALPPAQGVQMFWPRI